MHGRKGENAQVANCLVAGHGDENRRPDALVDEQELPRTNSRKETQKEGSNRFPDSELKRAGGGEKGLILLLGPS